MRLSPAMNESLISGLLYQSEGDALDFKEKHYAISRDNVRKDGVPSTEVNAELTKQKSEFLKDVLAMVNSWARGPRYILLGVRENPPHPAEVVGLDEAQLPDDADLQEFINSKTDAHVEFKYEKGLFNGAALALITIPDQPRPRFAKKDFGSVKADTVYVRRGSATAIANPAEIAKMGAASEKRQPATVQALLQDESGRPLGQEQVSATVVEFPDDLPDFSYAKPGGCPEFCV